MNSGSCTDTGGSRESTGAGAPAVEVTGGQYTGQGVTFLSEHGSVPAIYAEGAGVVILNGGSTIITTESHGYGIEVGAGGTVHANSIQITTEEYGSDAILAVGSGAYVSLEDVGIVAKGGSARGMRVSDGAVVGAPMYQ
ncbi:MAG: hypothetical protein KF874_02220 [Rhizobiaceae bacterium]|nr:hypothetical protein [Rhizobiaceae bacterium]